MSNHPNRGKRSAHSRPQPIEIAQVRLTSGLTPAQCAVLVFATVKQWSRWEAGAAPMHPGLFQLFKVKLAYMRGADTGIWITEGIPTRLYEELAP